MPDDLSHLDETVEKHLKEYHDLRQKARHELAKLLKLPYDNPLIELIMRNLR